MNGLFSCKMTCASSQDMSASFEKNCNKQKKRQTGLSFSTHFIQFHYNRGWFLLLFQFHIQLAPSCDQFDDSSMTHLQFLGSENWIMYRRVYYYVTGRYGFECSNLLHFWLKIRISRTGQTCMIGWPYLSQNCSDFARVKRSVFPGTSADRVRRMNNKRTTPLRLSSTAKCQGNVSQ